MTSSMALKERSSAPLTVDYDKERASGLEIEIESVIIFDVRHHANGTGSNGLVLEDFIFPLETSETRVAELYQPDEASPTEILYDAVGLELFDKVTHLEDEYYLTACEKEILQTKGSEIWSRIPDGSSIIELGCGSMTKTAVILDHLRTLGKKGIKFYALDLEEESLRNSIVSLMTSEIEQNIPEEYRIQYGGILGTYNQAMASLLKDIRGPKVFLWLGSSSGNYERPEAEAFLRKMQEEVMNKGDLFFVGIDNRNDPVTIAQAYNDKQGIVKKFVQNGLVHLGELLHKDPSFSTSFAVVSGYNNIAGKHEFYYKSLIQQTIAVPSTMPSKSKEVSLEKDEMIRIVVSVKYSFSEIQTLAVHAGLALDAHWMDSRNRYRFCLFKKAEVEESTTDDRNPENNLASKASLLME